MPTPKETIAEAPIRKGKELTGEIVSAKMQGTVVVAVTRYVRHPKYKKFVKQVKRYKVHDPNGSGTVGARVTIRESKPLSKEKHFVLV